MDALQAIVGILDSLGPGLVTIIVIMVALILIWLIIRASRRGSGQAKAAEHNAFGSRYDPQPAEPKAGRESDAADTYQNQPEETHFAAAAPVVEQVVVPQAKVQTSAVRVAEIAPEPEDSVLHRHYEAERAAKKAAMADPYPTDSVLRRHYDHLHKIQLDSEQQNVVVVSDAYDAKAQAAATVSAKASIIERTIQKEGQTIVAPVPATMVKPEVKAKIPQDSVLKRHFISQLRAEIALDLSPKPTDSVLLRHYDTLIQCELERRLQC